MQIQHKLTNTEGLNSQNIEKLVQDGARFIIFKYRVSLFAISFSRISPAILIRNLEEFFAYKNKYNTRTLLFGLWFFPYGPFDVYKTIKFNNKGAIDATEDILSNLEYYSKDSQTIEVRNIYTLFDHLPKNDLIELKAAIENYCVRKIEIREVYTGRHVNVEKHEEPPYFVGVNSNISKEILEKEMKELIYKKFHKFTRFEIFTKSEDPDLFERIVKQGQEIIKKTDDLR